MTYEQLIKDNTDLSHRRLMELYKELYETVLGCFQSDLQGFLTPIIPGYLARRDDLAKRQAKAVEALAPFHQYPEAVEIFESQLSLKYYEAQQDFHSIQFQNEHINELISNFNSKYDVQDSPRPD